MKGTSHAIIGITLSAVIAKQLGQPYGISEAAIAGIASLLPDIDEDSSTINKYVPLSYKKFIYGATGLYMAYYMYKTRSLALIIPALISILIYITGHRGFTHSIIAAALFSITFIKTPAYIYPYIIGYGLHLLCDMFNTKGLPLLYPMQKRFKYPIQFTVNSLAGKLIELGIVVLSVSLYWNIVGITIFG